MHWNILQSNLWDIATGDKFILLDTGNDNRGLNFVWFNNLNTSNGLKDVYDVKDGWLDEYMPQGVFDEGTYVEMCCKFIVGGEVYSVSVMTQLHKNANGEITVDDSKTVMKCLE
jgi:hypothetical protein